MIKTLNKQLNVYKFYAVARCPIQEQLDIYAATIETSEVITCEKIAKAVLLHSATTVYQEELASLLAADIGATVSLVGTHSGVEIVSTASGGSPHSSSSGGSESSS